jgi:hypothetical protein
MIHLMSQRDADLQRLPEGHQNAQVHSVSPYLNPAHVLAPPRRWLEAVASGAWAWEFFRLRYKSLLRSRFQAEPERFHALLEVSDGAKTLVLTCHCLGDRCHRELAREFLERLRVLRLQRAPARTQPRAARPAPRRLPPAREWSHEPSPHRVLATLIESPVATRTAQAARP